MAVGPTYAAVEYYATTPGNKSSVKFARNVSLMQLRSQARSETAIRAYLQTLHPKCEISIVKFDLK